MSPKVITVPYVEHRQDQSALEYALHLARIYDSHVQGIHVVPEPEIDNFSIPVLAYGPMPYVPESAVIDIRKANERRRKEAESAFAKTVKNLHVKNVAFYSQKGIIEDVVVSMARVSDLVIMPRTNENIYYNESANGVLFGSGCPVLLVPPDCKYRFNGKILIAWNDSREAANAVARALPYMEGNQVFIMTEEENKSRKNYTTTRDLKQFLERHDINVDLIPSLKKESSVPVSILNTALTLDAGMIVMGAWGHNRFHEFITGGVTDYMLHHADMPIFMVH